MNQRHEQLFAFLHSLRGGTEDVIVIRRLADDYRRSVLYGTRNGRDHILGDIAGILN